MKPRLWIILFFTLCSSVYAEESSVVLKKGQTLSQVFSELGLPESDSYSLFQEMRKVFKPKNMRPGVEVQSNFHPPMTKPLVYRVVLDPKNYLKIRYQGGEIYQVEEASKPSEMRIATYQGKINSSLWDSANDAKLQPQLIVELAEIFAWQVDFARELRTSDRWRMVVEEEYIDGNKVGAGKILTAEIMNQNISYVAILHENSKNPGYFSPEGESLRKMFLKSPIQFGKITSRFQRRRFHPILKIHRPHLGVDYGAPKGTPIRAVGDGTIVFAKTMGGAGKTIKLRHNSVYQTLYKHLNGYAPGIYSGKKVRQGQTIGYVGSTGLSTGPHLHFEFWENGRYVDPLGKKFPSAAPVLENERQDFFALAKERLLLLPSWQDHRQYVDAKSSLEKTSVIR